MSIDFEGNLSWKGVSWRVNWYSKIIESIHDYVWEEDDDAPTD